MARLKAGRIHLVQRIMLAFLTSALRDGCRNFDAVLMMMMPTPLMAAIGASIGDVTQCTPYDSHFFRWLCTECPPTGRFAVKFEFVVEVMVQWQAGREYRAPYDGIFDELTHSVPSTVFPGQCRDCYVAIEFGYGAAEREQRVCGKCYRRRKIRR